MKRNPSGIATDTLAPFAIATTVANTATAVILCLVARDYAIVQLFPFDITAVL